MNSATYQLLILFVLLTLLLKHIKLVLLLLPYHIIVILKDEQGNKVNEIPGIIEDIKPGETKQFHTAVSADYTNAYDFEITKR